MVQQMLFSIHVFPEKLCVFHQSEKALQLGLSKYTPIVYQNEAHVKQWHYNIHETVHEIAVA